MLDARGVLKVLDFGLAKQTGGMLSHDVSSAPTIFTTGEGVILGTPSYMAPEQIRGRPVDARADIFSLGVILYEMVTGVRPFRGASAMEVLIATARDELTPPRPSTPASPPASTPSSPAPSPRPPRTASPAATNSPPASTPCSSPSARPTSPPARSPHRPATDTRHRHGELVLPHGLLGRDAHFNALLAATDRAARGEVLLVLLRGESGLGKSSLLSALREPVTARGGRFAAGKFDHLARGAPLAPLAEALRAVARHILGEPADARARWLSDLAEATGPNRHVLDDMIPELYTLLGPPPRASSADAGEAKNRFHAAFQRLVRLFAARSPPLVLALDDLHGADPSALQLLELLLTDPAGGHLLVVATCRDIGDESHPLRVARDALRRLGATVVELPVEPLTHSRRGPLRRRGARLPGRRGRPAGPRARRRRPRQPRGAAPPPARPAPRGPAAVRQRREPLVVGHPHPDQPQRRRRRRLPRDQDPAPVPRRAARARDLRVRRPPRRPRDPQRDRRARPGGDRPRPARGPARRPAGPARRRRRGPPRRLHAAARRHPSGRVRAAVRRASAPRSTCRSAASCCRPARTCSPRSTTTSAAPRPSPTPTSASSSAASTSRPPAAPAA
jgi:hypothetical protein